jgi:hypothetical protein
MNIDKSILNRKVQIAFVECLILSLPLIILIFLEIWAGLMIFILAFFFYLIFFKKFNFRLEVFFYSISFASGWILWILLSLLFDYNIEELMIPDTISTLFYTLDLPSIVYSLFGTDFLPGILIFYALPSIILFYLFAISSKNDKKNRDKLFILFLTVFMILSLAFALLLDLTIMVCIFMVCSIFLPIIAGLYAGYYLIYRKLLSLHALSLVPIFTCLFMFPDLILIFSFLSPVYIILDFVGFNFLEKYYMIFLILIILIILIGNFALSYLFFSIYKKHRQTKK